VKCFFDILKNRNPELSGWRDPGRIHVAIDDRNHLDKILQQQHFKH
jgi:hypothetical protein